MKAPAWHLWFLAGSAVFSLGGDCTAQTYGELGQAQFSPLLKQCQPFDYRYAVSAYAAGGADDDISVTMLTHGCSHAAYQTIRSTQPEVAVLTAIPDGVHIKTGIPGTTELQLLDDHGKIVDKTPIKVQLIDHYAVLGGGVLLENVPVMLQYTAYNRIGTPLVDKNATQKAVSGSLTMLPTEDPCSPAKLIGSVGTGVFRLSSGEVSANSIFQVVSREQIASIAMRIGSISERGFVEVYASPKLVDGQEVNGALCQWSSTDSAIELHATYPDPNTIFFSSHPVSRADFILSHRGSFTVTCTIGAVAANATITW